MIISIIVIFTVPVLYTANRLVILAVNRKMSESDYTTVDSRKTFTLFDKKALLVICIFMVLMGLYDSGEENLMQFIAGVILLPGLWNLGLNLSYLFRLYFSKVYDRNFEFDNNLTIRVNHYGVLGFLVPLASITLITNHPLVGGGVLLPNIQADRGMEKVKESIQ